MSRPARKIAYTTVMTVMDNLHSKGWLRRQLDGRAYRYEPVATREQYSADLMREALDASQDPGTTLVHFLDQVTEAESDALRRELQRRKRRRSARLSRSCRPTPRCGLLDRPPSAA